MRTLEDMVTEVLTVGLPAIAHWATLVPGRPVPTILVDEDEDGTEYPVTREIVTEGLLTIALTDGHGMGLTDGARPFVRDVLFGRTDRAIDPEVADEVIQSGLFGEVHWS